MSLDKIENSNKAFIVGADEVGYGALAGPLVVCGVKALKGWSLEGLNDSKKLTEKKRNLMRDKLMPLIDKGDIRYHLVEKSNSEIDAYGLGAALKMAYTEIFTNLHCPNSLLIVDGILKFDKLVARGYDMVSLVKADAQIPAVMAASILAKTYRDDLMKKLDAQYPLYGWRSNVGYPSASHKAALEAHGPCSLHRMSYAPCRKAGSTSAQITREIDKEILQELENAVNKLND